jgi:hypothetical protein
MMRELIRGIFFVIFFWDEIAVIEKNRNLDVKLKIINKKSQII